MIQLKRHGARILALNAFVAIVLATTPVLASPIEPGAIRVVDGDTIEARGAVFRLVGFDTPEAGNRARCESERTLAAAASRRLRQLVGGGGLDFARVPCSCRPGTEGTQLCNHGRLCGTLRARGGDVGAILISEGLARPFLCGPQSCPAQQGWCD
jgi:endonuclease YncB( thermonuclease family)